MSQKTTHMLLTTAATLTITILSAAPAIAADMPSGLFLRGAESLGDFSKMESASPLEAPNVGSGCNTGDGAESVQCGINSDASGSSATALGANTIASGVGGTAVGNNADAVGSLSTAMGVHANASGIGSNAIGLRADASGNFASAVGRNADASGTGSTAIGLDSTASGNYAQAFGRNANASGPASIAIGVNSEATAPDTIAIGNNASSTFANSIAIGDGASATRTNQVMLGAATSTYTLAGITSAVSRGQQGTVVGVLTTDANGNLASDGGALHAQVNDHEMRITGLEGEVSQTMHATATRITPDSRPATSPTPPPTTISTPGSSLTAESNLATQATTTPTPGSSLTSIKTARSVAEPLPAELYGSNLEVTTQQGATNSNNISANATNIATNAQNVAVTSQRVGVNSQRIASNATSISQNAQSIELAMGSILTNSQAIIRNTEEIAELSSGLAAVTALPDMYLSPDAKWSASGGVGMYGDDVGVGATLAIRAGRNLAFGASVASGGDKATGKLQVRYEGF